MATNVRKEEARPQVGEAVSKTELFFKKYGNTIVWTGVALIAVLAIVLAAIQFWYKPAVKEAQGQAYAAEQNFAAGEFETALNGDGNSLGFAQIISEYGSKAGKSMYLYAGICELQLKNGEGALSYLNKYSGGDAILSARAECCKGDAYALLENYSKAISCYMKAADIADNSFAASYLLKAGILNEETGNTEAALKCYNRIKDNYPQTYEGFEVDKYISRIQK